MGTLDATAVRPGRAKESRRDLVLVAGLTLIGGWLRLATLGYLSFFGDEIWTLKWSRAPVSEILDSYGLGLTSHLHVLLMKPWLAVAGTSALAAKLPSLVAGISLIPAVYLIGRRWLDPTLGSVAAVFVALSSPLILFSRIARVYVLMALLLLFAMDRFLRVVRNGKLLDLGLLTLANAALLLASLNAVYVLLIQGCAVVWEAALPSGRRKLERWTAIAGSFAGAAGLAFLFYLGPYERILAVRAHWSGAPFRPGMLWGSFAINHPSLPFVFFGLLALGCWKTLRHDGAVGRLLVLSATVPPLFLFVQRPSLTDGHIARYLLPTLPLQLVAAACGLLAIARWVFPRRPGWRFGVTAGIAALLMLANPAATANWFTEKLPFDRAVAALARDAREGDRLTTFGYPPFEEQVEYQDVFPVSSIPELIRDPSLAGGGRLLIVTIDLPKAVPRWSDRFQVERIEHPRFTQRLYVLVSRPLEPGADAFAAPLQTFFSGILEATERGNRLHHRPFFHYQLLAQSHQHLASLARSAGRTDAADAHARQAEASLREARGHAALR